MTVGRRIKTKYYSYKAKKKHNRRRKASGLEKTVYAILKEEGIPFEREKAVGRCHADLLIKDNIIVELNGDYWHYHSTCQNKLPNEMQRANMAKDARRYAFFRKLGFNVNVIWECEVEKDPEAVRLKLRALYNKGD